MPIQHMLVPFDFSPYAEQALAYAIGLAQTLQARITLLYVRDTMSWGVAQAEATIPPSVWQQLETSLAEGMEEPLARVHEAGLQGETVIAEGIPFQTIVDTAGDRDCSGQVKTDTQLSGTRNVFILIGAHIPKIRMLPLTVGEHFDVIDYIIASFLPRLVILI